MTIGTAKNVRRKIKSFNLVTTRVIFTKEREREGEGGGGGVIIASHFVRNFLQITSEKCELREHKVVETSLVEHEPTLVRLPHLRGNFIRDSVSYE